jgi:hypothetical protein
MPTPLELAALPCSAAALRRLLLQREAEHAAAQEQHAAELLAARNGLQELTLLHEKLKLRHARLLRQQYGLVREAAGRHRSAGTHTWRHRGADRRADAAGASACAGTAYIGSDRNHATQAGSSAAARQPAASRGGAHRSLRLPAVRRCIAPPR